MTQTGTIAQTTTVVAEDAPIGVQLWPTTSLEHAGNFTLASVEVITRTTRDAFGSSATATVLWTYCNGTQRTFRTGERVAVQL